MWYITLRLLVTHTMDLRMIMSQVKLDQPDRQDDKQTVPERSTDIIRAITRSRGENPAPLTGNIDISELQQKDPHVKIIYQWVKKNQRSGHAEVRKLAPAIRHYWHLWNSLCIVNDILCKRFYSRGDNAEHLQIIVPQSLRSTVLNYMHNSLMGGHLGVNKTYGKLKQRIYWYEAKEDVLIWVRKCDTWAQNKPAQKTPKAHLGDNQVGGPMDRLATDLLGPLPETPQGNKYILVVTDHFTKWVEAIPVPDQTAQTCAHHILKVICQFRCPLTILSDQGRCYESNLFHELCHILEIKKTRTSPRNPKCNGLAERFNRTLIQMIKSYLKGEQIEWDKNLHFITAAYRATPQDSTGFTPNVLMLGRETRLPVELVLGNTTSEGVLTNYGEYVQDIRQHLVRAHDVARRHLGQAAQHQREIYDIRTSQHYYQEGQLVWYLNQNRKEGTCLKLQHTIWVLL